KLKVLSKSLANSSAKVEKRIMENRLQKEESLIFRVTKTNEVSGIEKIETEKLLAQLVETEMNRRLLIFCKSFHGSTPPVPLPADDASGRFHSTNVTESKVFYLKMKGDYH
ncbi:hypothetical protein ACJX0J_027988, partial [Zea mays]